MIHDNWIGSQLNLLKKILNPPNPANPTMGGLGLRNPKKQILLSSDWPFLPGREFAVKPEQCLVGIALVVVFFLTLIVFLVEYFFSKSYGFLR